MPSVSEGQRESMMSAQEPTGKLPSCGSGPVGLDREAEPRPGTPGSQCEVGLGLARAGEAGRGLRLGLGQGRCGAALGGRVWQWSENELDVSFRSKIRSNSSLLP